MLFSNVELIKDIVIELNLLQNGKSIDKVIFLIVKSTITLILI